MLLEESDMISQLIKSLLLLVLVMAAGCTTYSKEKFAEENPQVAARMTRWTVNEEPYEEAPTSEKIARNARDGLVGFVDSYFLGFYSAQVIISRSGFLTQKISVFVGDIVGLVDDNPWTEHVFKGIVSRQFYRLGSRAEGMPDAISKIHERDYAYLDKDTFDYIGDRPFHHDVYFEPGAIPTLLGVVFGDFFIRPTGKLLQVFSLREAGMAVDEAGHKVIEKGLQIPFL